jgi:hypothetical protein
MATKRKIGVVTVGIRNEVFYLDFYILQTGGATDTSQESIFRTNHLAYSVAYAKI